MTKPRDHGGGLDAAIAQYGGARDSWIDLSTGINPVAYPIGDITQNAWTALPDSAAFGRLTDAARQFWNVPNTASVVPASGASAIIACLPRLAPTGAVYIPGPTYNEHAAAFEFHGREVIQNASAQTHVYVHPNNPDGRMIGPEDLSRPTLTIIDESFCDVMPERSLIDATSMPGTIVLKSFGKFWGLAGARLGFAIGHPDTLSGLAEHLGPWPVAGPTLSIATRALGDQNWASKTRDRLASDAQRIDALALSGRATLVGGTSLFRLYDVDDASGWQAYFAEHTILTRIFPYNPRWIRFGLPHPDDWTRVERAFHL